MPKLPHALETENGWFDYGRAAPKMNLDVQFVLLWANLKKLRPEFDNNDRARFHAAFVRGARTRANAPQLLDSEPLLNP
jgi:hypothetical protein